MGSIPEAVLERVNVTPNIIDIRSDAAGIELKQEILAGLKPANGKEKTLPTLLLYDEQGLKLFERITYLQEYYLTGEEIAVLDRHADNIAERVPNQSMLVELGSGYAYIHYRQVSDTRGITDHVTATSGKSRSCLTLWRGLARLSRTTLWI